MQVSDLQLNPQNPRTISAAAFDQLVESIREFPKMMELRPMVIDADNVVIGGNQRLKAIQALGMEEVPETWVKPASELTPEERKRFIVMDNLTSGEWEFTILARDFDVTALAEWGIDIPEVNIDMDEITDVLGFNEGVDFLIKCASLDELAELQTKLGTTGRKLTYIDFLSKLGL